MKLAEAKKTFETLRKKLKPTCPLPLNKQKDDKAGYAYLTGLVNMIIEANSRGFDCNYDPKELTAFTQNKFPVRTLSRRVDGAFPNVINPLAIWEIKEYYFTTTFGSRVADGVYETWLDGLELREVKEIDQQLNIIRNKGRQVFLETNPENFSRILHDYSDKKKGFIIWKRDNNTTTSYCSRLDKVG